MIQISKEEAQYIFEKMGSEHEVVVCSKRKHGHKRGTSGKTYYCPEERKYTNLIKEFYKNSCYKVVEEYPSK